MMKRPSSLLYLFLLSFIFFPYSSISSQADPQDATDISLYSNIHLTEKEQNWLRQNHVIRARVGSNPPLHFYDGQNRGISVDYFNLIAEVAGFQVKYVHGIPWSEAIEDIKKQEKFDLLLTAKNTKERRPYMRFSDDYLLMPWVIFSRTNSGFVGSISDLSGKTVAVEKSFVMQKKLQAEYPDINLLVKKHSVESLQAVASGEADAYIGNLATSTYIINKHNLTNLKVACPAPFDNHNQAFAVRNDWPEFVSILDKAINAIPSSELTRLRNKWYNVKFEYGISKTDLFKWIGSVVGFFLILLLFFAYKNIRLRVQIAKRKKVEEETLESHNRLIESHRLAKMGYFTWDLETDKVSWSDGLRDMFRYANFETIDADHVRRDIHYADDSDGINKWLKDCITSGSNILTPYEYRVVCGDGDIIYVRTVGEIKYERGLATLVFGAVLDITEQKKTEGEKKELESRLQQAQKMEAIGTLAGGIAHDFNNLLGVILGYTELAKEDTPPGTDIDKDLDEILGAANRAKDLVKQILAFSRQSQLERLPIKIQPLIKESLGMLRSSLPTTISITEDIDPGCGAILADPSQVNQILMNLCTNAYHALEITGGTLSVALKTIFIKADDKKLLGHLSPGEYVHFSVSDTGVGIGPDILEKIFDPYFTTKEIGKGTGMGLAIIHGIMKDSGGTITVESQLGQGATFNIYFPTVTEDVLPVKKEQEDMLRGKERVLFVDDEAILAEMGKDMLERLGYHVTVQHSSLEALAIFKNTPDKFDLVITDQTMPEMTGTDLAGRMLQIRPMMPIILCTGYSNLIDDDSFKSIGIRELALKPFTKGEMAKLIRKVLDVA